MTPSLPTRQWRLGWILRSASKWWGMEFRNKIPISSEIIGKRSGADQREENRSRLNTKPFKLMVTSISQDAVFFSHQSCFILGG
jgi:hypothetical protein